jgi:anti-sigma regulatory factor (Ser/Thr protein kinase)
MSVLIRRLRGGALAARQARRAVREELGEALPEPRLHDIELLVSELATNSVRHGGCDESGEIELEAELDDECVRVRLCDPGAGFGGRPDPTPAEDAGGFGLVLLDRLSDRWGTQHNGGFCVWFEVARARAA